MKLLKVVPAALLALLMATPSRASEDVWVHVVTLKCIDPQEHSDRIYIRWNGGKTLTRVGMDRGEVTRIDIGRSFPKAAGYVALELWEDDKPFRGWRDDFLGRKWVPVNRSKLHTLTFKGRNYHYELTVRVGSR